MKSILEVLGIISFKDLDCFFEGKMNEEDSHEKIYENIGEKMKKIYIEKTKSENTNIDEENFQLLAKNLFQDITSFHYFSYLTHSMKKVVLELFLSEICSEIKSNVKNLEYFSDRESILEKQKKACKLDLRTPYPHSTSNVILPNFLFGKRVKDDGKNLGDGKKNFESSLNENYLKEKFCFSFDTFSLDYINEIKTKKITVIVQTRGVGKTHYLMSHAVSDNEPTIYIDCSNDQLLKNVIQEINLETKSFDISENSRKAIVCFFFVFK